MIRDDFLEKYFMFIHLRIWTFFKRNVLSYVATGASSEPSTIYSTSDSEKIKLASLLALRLGP